MATSCISIRIWMELNHVVVGRLCCFFEILEFGCVVIILLTICCTVSCWIATFTKHFGKYGEIVDSVIMKDRFTGTPRGFGFITYADPSVVDKVIEDPHVINGKQVKVVLHDCFFWWFIMSSLI